jgi:hypothetical protein
MAEPIMPPATATENHICTRPICMCWPTLDFGAYGMDPMMGIVRAVLVARWYWGLLTATGSVLLDRQAPDTVCTKICEAIEADGDAPISAECRDRLSGVCRRSRTRRAKGSRP